MSHRHPISFLQSLRVAARGVREAIAEERNLRTHLVITAFVVLLGAWLRVSPVEWGLLLLCIGLVLSVELLNTAVEAVVDLTSPEYHELARKAKDIAAGAVLTVTVLAVLIGLVILLPPLAARVRTPPAHEPPAGRNSAVRLPILHPEAGNSPRTTEICPRPVSPAC